DFEIQQLKVFNTVVECEGFSAAETELNISRPTISNHIANLESRLDMKLCRRGRGGFALTEEGEVIYEQTKQLLGQLEQFRNTINNLSASPSGQLKIAVSDTLSQDQRCQMPDIFRVFHQKAPNVEMHVDVEHMKSMEKLVMTGQLDVAIIPYHRRLEGLNYVHLFTDINYLYCGEGHPLFNMKEDEVSEDLVNAQKLIHAGLKPHEEIYQQISQMNLAGTSYFYESRIAMILSGCYIGFLPEEIAKPYVENGELKAIATETKQFLLGVAVIYKKSSQPNRAKELFLQTIQEIHHDAEEAPPY
ncbi:LysR family transcriptional regulator, partial [Pontibacterium sp.]|uniref:LysR family transcriptional regulator n=1 Tax=Pontibacterium sp. TaxID=2036026 RepID=UPI003512F74F